MKGKATLKKELEMGTFDYIGTSPSVGLPSGTTYNELVKVFGRPQRRNKSGNKIQVEWVGKLNGEVFTIYDYKTGVHYIQNKEWNIGSRNKSLAERVKIFFELNK